MNNELREEFRFFSNERIKHARRVGHIFVDVIVIACRFHGTVPQLVVIADRGEVGKDRI